MKIPIFCERCGELIATFDTTYDTSSDWAEAPCGEKVCEECCENCAKQFAATMFVPSENGQGCSTGVE